MQFMKKYININLFFVMSLSLCSLPITSAEFMYDAIPTKEVTDAGKAFSEVVSGMISENSMIMPVAGAAAIIGLLLYGKRGMIQQQYDVTLKEMKEKKEKIEDSFPLPVKKAIDMSKLVFLCSVRPMAGGISNYFQHNKWHLIFSTASFATGYVLAYQMTGALVAGTISAAGYMRQGYYELKAEVDKFREENKELHGETHEKIAEVQKSIAEIDEKTTRLLKQMQDAEEQIVTKLGNLEAVVEKKNQQVMEKTEESKAELKKDIQVIGVELEKLRSGLKDASQNVLDLRAELVSVAQQNNEIIKNNEALIKDTQDARTKITNTLDQVVLTQTKLNELGIRFTSEMKKLDQKIEAVGQKVEKLDQKIDDKFDIQRSEIKKFKAEIQMRNLEQLGELKKGLEEKLEDVSGTFSILTSLSKNIKEDQESRDAQIAQLLSDSQEGKKASAETREMINKVMQAQSASATANAQMLKDINSIRESSSDVAADILPKLGIIDRRLTSISEDMKVMKSKLKKEKDARKNLESIIAGVHSTVTTLSLQNMQLLTKMSQLEKTTAEINKTTTETNAIARNVVSPCQKQLGDRRYSDPNFVVHLDENKSNTGVIRWQ